MYSMLDIIYDKIYYIIYHILHLKIYLLCIKHYINIYI